MSSGGLGKGLLIPETFESSLPGVYLAGVVQAGLNTSKLFIENTRHHGEVIVSHILGRRQWSK